MNRLLNTENPEVTLLSTDPASQYGPQVVSATAAPTVIRLRNRETLPVSTFSILVFK